MNALRSIPGLLGVTNEDTTTAVVAGVESAISVILVWYKSRGKTANAIMVDWADYFTPLTIEEAERILAKNNL